MYFFCCGPPRVWFSPSTSRILPGCTDCRPGHDGGITDGTRREIRLGYIKGHDGDVRIALRLPPGDNINRVERYSAKYQYKPADTVKHLLSLWFDFRLSRFPKVTVNRFSSYVFFCNDDNMYVPVDHINTALFITHKTVNNCLESIKFYIVNFNIL